MIVILHYECYSSSLDNQGNLTTRRMKTKMVKIKRKIRGDRTTNSRIYENYLCFVLVNFLSLWLKRLLPLFIFNHSPLIRKHPLLGVCPYWSLHLLICISVPIRNARLPLIFIFIVWKLISDSKYKFPIQSRA